MEFKTRMATLGGAAVVAFGLMICAKPAITAVYSTPVRDVDNAARGAVQIRGYASVAEGVFETYQTIYTVPANCNCRLVIDTISAGVVGPSGQRAQVRFSVAGGTPNSQGGYTNLDLFAPLNAWFPIYGSRDVSGGTTPVTAYVDAGNSVVLWLTREATQADGQMHTTTAGFTGHFVYLP